MVNAPKKIPSITPYQTNQNEKEVDKYRNSFGCSTSDVPDKQVCWNYGPVDMIKGASIPLQFQLHAPGLVAEPSESYDIRIEIAYTYELRDSAQARIVPVLGQP